MTERRRWWHRFVDAAAVVWIGLFLIDVAGGEGLLALSRGTTVAVRWSLRALLVVFLADVVLLYRWSALAPAAFLRSNWLYVLTVVPWFRPLRVLRAGRGLRALRLLVRSRRTGSLLNKLRRTLTRLWQRLGE